MFGNLPTYSILGNSDLIGEEGKVYDLRVEYDTIVATASTIMHPTIPLDDSYFYFPENSTSDSLGIINIVYTDPDSLEITIVGLHVGQTLIRIGTLQAK